MNLVDENITETTHRNVHSNRNTLLHTTSNPLCNKICSYHSLETWKNLSLEEEKEYILRAKNGDESSLLVILGGVLNYVWKQAKFYSHKNMLDPEDLLTEGLLGIMDAVQNYDLQSDANFLTFASIYSKAFMFKYIKKCGSIITIPSNKLDAYFRIKNRFHYDENVTDLLNVLEEENLSLFDYNKIYQIRHMWSLDKRNDYDFDVVGAEATLLDVLEDPNTNVLKDIVETQTKKQLKEIVDTAFTEVLTEKEQQIIKLRFGFINDKKYSLKEIGDMMNRSRNRIRQIEVHALRKLRYAIRYTYHVVLPEEYYIE